jgi:hypothetical protein
VIHDIAVVYGGTKGFDVAEIALNEFYGQVLEVIEAAAGADETTDVLTALDQRPDEVRADKSCSTGYECSQSRSG